MSLHIASKQPDLKLSIFTVITTLSERYKALNLSQGFPDFDPVPRLMALVEKALRQGKNQYAPMPGILPLRKAISEKIQHLYGAVYDPEEEITITAGATEALYAAITATVSAGDEVIIFEPFYDAYPPIVKYVGAKPVFIHLKPPDFRIPWLRVKQALNKRTKMIILNTPHNPTGRLIDREDLAQLAGIVDGTPILIVSDEVYEHITFDGLTFTSLAAHDELRRRTFVISSFGKTYHATGWKVGYCAAPQAMTEALRKIHQFITYAVNTPAQWAYAAFLPSDRSYLELGRFYQKKRDTFAHLLRASRFKLLSCSGTYFQLVDYGSISPQPDLEFVGWLIKEHGVAAIPLSPFYNRPNKQTLIRFCFAKKDVTLKQAAERLCRI